MTGKLELEAPTRGQYVEVVGLQSQKGRLLNKQRGLVIKANHDTGRIEVCLGAEGKIASLKPGCLRLVPGASAEEMQDAKDVAAFALHAAQDSCSLPVRDDILADAATPGPPKRERSRSWSPPPEAVRAASLAGQQASSAAVARGLSSEEAEALGATAAQQLLARVEQEANLNTKGEGQHAFVSNADQATRAADCGEAAAAEKKTSVSLESLQIGDTVLAIGLKGADMELNGQRFKIEDFKGFGGARSRKYVVSTTQIVINECGDPAEKKKVMTLLAKNIRLPGDEAVDQERIESSDDSSSSKRKRKKSNAKRSRSRRRRRSRSKSDSSSSSSKPARATHHGKRPMATLTKAERLSRFKFK